MIKIVAILLSIGLASLTSLLSFDVAWYYHALIILGFTITYLIGFVILFFLLWTLSVFYVSNKKEYNQSKFSNFTMRWITLVGLSLFSVKIHGTGKEIAYGLNSNYLLVTNHKSNLDSLIEDRYLWKSNMVFVAKKSLFKIPFVRKLIRGNGYLLLDRDDLRQEIKTIKRAVDTLENSNVTVTIFPEGTRSKDDTILDFKGGSFKIAMRSKKPIVLGAIYNSNKINDGLLIRRHHVYLSIIEAIPYEKYSEMDTELLAKYCHDKIEAEYKRLKEVHSK